MAGQMSLEAAYRQAQDIDRDNRRVEPVPKQTDNDNEVTLVTHDGVAVPYPAPKKAKFNKTPGEGISWAQLVVEPGDRLSARLPLLLRSRHRHQRRHEAGLPGGLYPAVSSRTVRGAGQYRGAAR